MSLPTARRRQRNLIPRVVVMDGEEVVHGPGGMMQRPELAAVDALAFLDKPAAEALFAWLVTRHKFSPERFSLVVASREGRRGVEELRRYDLMMQLGVASTFEFDTVTLLLDAGFKDFETNATIELPGYPQFCVDILFRYKKTIVECDGRRYHQHDEAFETDRARDRALQASGYKVLRVTWRTIHEEPEAFLAELRAALA
ncbi:MAG: DUF559 domain-containing protein [Micrococcales bacterium]|nr:DUF559 domain-containing protein [Micrococcales bacterium]